MGIKPIETEYNGYRFRSRLEARWAVFFDALGIKYEYEKEGYELESGWYLPDFWLPDFNMWAEVKGQELTEREKSLCSELAIASNKKVAILYSDIQPFDMKNKSNFDKMNYEEMQDAMNNGVVYDSWWEYKGNNGVFDTKGKYDTLHSFFVCERCNNVVFCWSLIEVCFECITCNTLDHLEKKRTLLQKAYQKARSARFEHGEKPLINATT